MASDPQPPSAQTVSDDGLHPRDMSQYIRTYAKDVAKLTGQPTPPAAAQPAPTAQGTVTSQGVTLPEVDVSPVQHTTAASPKEFPQEVLSVSKEDSDGLFSNPPAIPPSLAPSSPTPPTPVVPSPQPVVPEEDKRQEILERLRTKFATEQKANAALSQPPPPTIPPIVPKETVWQPPAPPMPAPAPAPEAVPTPTPTPEPLQSSPLHTYTSDFADRIDEKGASTISVLAAEQDRTDRPVSSVKRKSLLPVVLATMLIVLGIGGIGTALYLANPNQGQPETLGVPSLIFADEKMELTGPDYRQQLADAANQPLVEGNVLITYVTNATTTTAGLLKEPQPGGVLMRLLNLGAPDILLRNVDIVSTVGVITAGGETRPFFLMRVSSFERTFAGMLGWEPRLAQDLAPFYPPYALPAEDLVAASTSTATSTQDAPVALEPSLPTEFTDAVVANRDVRILRDGFGRSIVLYGYADRQTLIIARDEASFTALIARLAAGAGQ